MNIQEIIDKAERIHKDWTKFDAERHGGVKDEIKSKLKAGLKYLKDTMNASSAHLTRASSATDERS